MEKRIDRRIKKKLVVSFGEEGFENIAITENISTQGLCILSHIPLAADRKIHLNLAIDDKIFQIEGRVIWSRFLQAGNRQKSMKGAGIRIIRAPEDYHTQVDFYYWTNHFKDTM